MSQGILSFCKERNKMNWIYWEIKRSLFHLISVCVKFHITAVETLETETNRSSWKCECKWYEKKKKTIPRKFLRNTKIWLALFPHILSYIVCGH